MAEFTFKLEGEVAEQLEKLAAQLKVSPEVALSRALANTAFLATQTEQGSDVLLRRRDKRMDLVNLGLKPG